MLTKLINKENNNLKKNNFIGRRKNGLISTKVSIFAQINLISSPCGPPTQDGDLVLLMTSPQVVNCHGVNDAIDTQECENWGVEVVLCARGGQEAFCLSDTYRQDINKVDTHLELRPY